METTYYHLLKKKSPCVTSIDIYFYKDKWLSRFKRRCSIILLHASLCNNPLWCGVTKQNKIKILENIERSTYNEVRKKTLETHRSPSWSDPVFINIYNIHIGEKCASLDYFDNQIFSDEIINEIEKSKTIGLLSWNDMNEIDVECIQRVAARKEIDPTRSVKTTSFFPCPKCKHAKATFYETQDRSSDEGKTTRYTCMNKSCNNKWSERA